MIIHLSIGRKSDKLKQSLKNRFRQTWLRWFCYFMLIIGFGLTFFHDQVAKGFGISVNLLQVVAIITLIIGVVLYFIIREPGNMNRREAYRTFFGKEDINSETKGEDSSSHQ